MLPVPEYVLLIPIWPWFDVSISSFDTDKITRKPNRCIGCGRLMVDIGASQIIYQCLHEECPSYRTAQSINPYSGEPGYDPYLGAALVFNAIAYIHERTPTDEEAVSMLEAALCRTFIEYKTVRELCI